MSAEHLPFVVGVTGKMKIPGYRDEVWEPERFAGAVRAVYDQVFAILDWIRYDAPPRQPAGILHPESGKFLKDQDGEPGWRALGLGDGPIVLLSSLAPGADTIVAEAALDYAKEHPEARVSVRGLVGFPIEHYREATTFCPRNEEHLWAARQARFDHLCARILEQPPGPHGDPLLEVALHEAVAGYALEDLTAAPGGRARRHLRYRAAGESVAAACHLLLAVYDETQESDLDLYDPYNSGTRAVVQAKIEGLSFQLLAAPNVFAWADSGPVLRIPIDASGDGKNPCGRPLARFHPIDLKPVHLKQPPIWKRVMIEMGVQRPEECKPKKRQRTPGSSESKELGGNPTPVAESDREVWGAGKARPSSHLSSLASESDRDKVSGSERSEEREARIWNENGDRFFRRVLRYQRRFNRLPVNEANEAKSLENKLAATGTKKSDERVPLTDAAREYCGRLSPLASIRERASRHASHLDGVRSALLWKLLWLIFAAAALIGIYEHWVPCVPSPHKDSLGEGWQTTSLESIVKAGLLAAALSTLGTIGYLFFRYRASDAERNRYDWRALSEGLRVQFAWIMAGVPQAVSASYMQRQREEMDWIRRAIQSISGETESWARDYRRLSDADRASLLVRVLNSWVCEQMDYFRKESTKAEGQRHFWHVWGWAFASAGLINIVAKFLDALVPPVEHYLHDHWGQAAAGAVLLGTGVLAFAAIRAYRREQEGHHGAHGESAPPRWFLGWFFARPIQWGWALLLCPLPLLLANAFGRIGDWCPDVHRWWMILTGLIILLGALFLTWGERNLFAEDARRYRAMASLFTSAHLRLKRLIVNPDPAVVAKSEPEIHDLLHRLGNEALAENAEWLILHRTHPLEPFMAG